MAVKCPKCQTDNPDSKQFCGDCGTQLTPSDEASPSMTKTLETPTDPGIVEVEDARMRLAGLTSN